MSWGIRLATGYFCSVSVYNFHSERPGGCVLCCVCCDGGCTSQERINPSAAATAPYIFFQPFSSPLAYYGFSEQCLQWDTVSQCVCVWGKGSCICPPLLTENKEKCSWILSIGSSSSVFRGQSLFSYGSIISLVYHELCFMLHSTHFILLSVL